MSPLSFKPAKRERVGLLCGLAGASGSGKTYSALRLAKGLAGDQRFAFIDTENGRALHYADSFDFDHAVLDPPFRPSAYLEAVKGAEEAGYPVIVVDSMSHEYSGQGGLQDWQVEELDRMAGDNQAKRNKLSAPAWSKPKMAHARFVSDLLRVQAHLILCFRARQAIEMVQENGRTVVRPTQALDSFEGWLIDTEHKRMPLPFELTCSFLMLPDTPGVPHPMKLPDPLRPMVPLGQPITEATGRELARWAAGNPDASKAARGSGKAAEPDDELGARAKELTDAIVAVVEPARRDAVYSEIAKNRHLHADDLGAHIAWLGAQKERAEAKAAQRTDEDLDL